ncbi:MAG: NHL repeat-containing protein [Paludibacter sp.]|nr:NHL repeat-containing protein [Paludibacter sp.]
MKKTFLLSISICAIMFVSPIICAQAPSLRAPFAKRVLIQGTNMGVGSGKTFKMLNDGGAIPASPRFSEVTTTTYKPPTSTAVAGMQDGDVAVSKWNSPYGLCLDASGNLIVVEKWNSHRIRKIDFSSGQVTTIAGDNSAQVGASGYIDANGTSARFNQPTDAIMDSNGNIFISDLGNYYIRKIATNGDVTTFAGSGVSGSADGTGTEASFGGVFGLAIDADDNIYATDRTNHLIRKITPAGVVTTFAGSTSGSLDGTGTSAKFNNPAGIDIDAAGNLYVADAGGNQIRKITPEGVVTTLAGTGTAGVADGEGTVATFNQPIGVAVDEFGYIYVADYTGRKLRRVSSTGYVKTIAGNGGGSFVDNVTGTSAYFRAPSDIVYDKNKRCIFMADNTNYAIRKINLTGCFADRLPAGFSMNMGTGEIYGTPSTVSAPFDYNFEGYNTSGGSSVNMSIEVVASGSTVYTISSSVTGGNGQISGTQEVVSGGNATFTITPNSGYEIASLTLNGVNQSFTPDQTSFTTTNVLSDASLVVSYSEKISTALNNSIANNIRCISNRGILVVEGVLPHQNVVIFTSSGNQVVSGKGNCEFNLSPGFYIIKVDNTLMKLIHK